MTTTTPSLTHKSHRRAWLFLWLAFLLIESALLLNHATLDTYSWCSTRWFVGDRDYYSWKDFSAANAATDPATQPFYTHTPPPLNARLYHETQRLWEILKDFGEPWMAAILIAALLLYHEHRYKTAAIAILATALAGGAGALIRIFAGRTRPTHIDGANLWEFLRGFHNGTDLSFPSGHATLAFALAATLTYFSPRGRPLFLTIAAGTALSRVIMGAHFYSDALFGAILGWTIAWFTCVFCDKLLTPKAGDAIAGAPQTNHPLNQN